ncbi:MAG TPA: peptidoglycan DD-metalloendopeptidase family protein [Flavobacteriales bacterium]|nr:peptidoglycan DD-metalloendopeptidase family protein [Flavobacteriales bacterium]MCC6654409.1 peptidoglycan DD-metalloendopeptidase family protein [Flavobacteriales bacterium]HNE79610.1 peptidoglycan DD-metalloendopeptidase family protein [Flavobacteriales bacterium]HNI03582.1 peptidoglycan DD-metalloendopeptidase family protein [Flavobacteriales bacterium]HNK67378.1 peptidoglycan DD-metalloendopeptidase family protein [Flavobacteriales bacterium]
MSLLLTWTATAQSRKDLEKKRDQLDKQIKTTSALISAGEREQRATQRQLELLQAQIRQRQELIGTMNSEVFRVDKEIGETEELIEALGSDLARLKEEYARMLQYAYMNRDTYDRLSYLFAARSFTQAFQRSRYLDQLADRRRQQAALITDTQASLERRADDLKNRRTEKVSLLNEQVSEREKLSADRGAHESTLSGLRRQEDKLRGTLREQKSRRERIAIEIKRAIEAEVRKSAKPAKGGTTSGGAASSGKLELSLTPEARELGSDFEKNKGKLPWPVAKGTITEGYGEHDHPVLRGVKTYNNGIDITCEKGAPVRAIFRGEVSSVIVIPGAGKAVVISHGAYRTVYSNLRESSVSKGQKVDTKQTVGTVLTNEDGSTAHIEIWKITAAGDLVKVDPGQWIYRD